ncbi:MAG: DUF3810 family protein, partial [Saprospiraceae bacterium]
MPKFPKWIASLLFGLLTLLLNTLAHHRPEWVEQWYSRGLFLLVRQILDWTIGRLPVPGFYLFWIGITLGWIWLVRRRPALDSFWLKFRHWAARLLGFAGLMIGLFYWMWGFNYARIPLKEQMGLSVQPLDSALLW